MLDNVYASIHTQYLADFAGVSFSEWSTHIFEGFSGGWGFYAGGRSRGGCPVVEYRVRQSFDFNSVEGGQVNHHIQIRVMDVVDCSRSQNDAKSLVYEIGSKIRSDLRLDRGIGTLTTSSVEVRADGTVLADAELVLEESYNNWNYRLIPSDIPARISVPSADNALDAIITATENLLKSELLSSRICQDYAGDWDTHIFQTLYDSYQGFGSARCRGCIPYIEFEVDVNDVPTANDGGMQTAIISLRVHNHFDCDMASAAENANLIITECARLIRNRYGLVWGWPGELEIMEPVIMPSNHLYQDAIYTMEFSFDNFLVEPSSESSSTSSTSSEFSPSSLSSGSSESSVYNPLCPQIVEIISGTLISGSVYNLCDDDGNFLVIGEEN